MGLNRRVTNGVADVAMFTSAAALVLLLLAVYVFMASKGLATFGHVSPVDFLFRAHWDPLSANPSYGAAAIILGSIVVVGLAILLATPLSLAAALFLEHTDPVVGERLVRPAIEVFVGIPSVVYGYVGLTLLVPFIRTHSSSPTGLSVLAAALVLTVMILPTVTGLSADALRRVPVGMVEASYALGATRWQTIYKVILPAARGGITSGIVLGIARALGEALAVAFVIGNVPNLPRSLFGPAATMTTIITQDLANRDLNPVLNDALYTLGLVLLSFSLIAIIVIRRAAARLDVR
jgi:phosphate transport system permease protein